MTINERINDRVKNDPVKKEEPGFSTADFVAGGGGAKMAPIEKPAALFNESEAHDLRARWSDVQTGFVDEPRECVQKADNLVASTMKRLAEMFAEERANLEKQWARGDDVSTEDLRVALQRYRSFFNRLLSM